MVEEEHGNGSPAAKCGAESGLDGEGETTGLGDGEGSRGMSSRGKVKGPWSPEEDAVLSRLVSQFGARNWSLIARGIPSRSGKSCRLRWCNQLDPCLKRKPFTGKPPSLAAVNVYIRVRAHLFMHCCIWNGFHFELSCCGVSFFVLFSVLFWSFIGCS